jgi:hypothetical protein
MFELALTLKAYRYIVCETRNAAVTFVGITLPDHRTIIQ